MPTRPILPDRMNSLARVTCGVERRCVPICTTRFVFEAVASIALPSSIVWQIGFSQYTSAPAVIAAMACRACQWSGLPTMTASSLPGFNISRKSAWVAVSCWPHVFVNSAAVASSCFESGSATATTSTLRLPLVAMSRLRRLTMPYQPQPTRPTRRVSPTSARTGERSAASASAAADDVAKKWRRSMRATPVG